MPNMLASPSAAPLRTANSTKVLGVPTYEAGPSTIANNGPACSSQENQPSLPSKVRVFPMGRLKPYTALSPLPSACEAIAASYTSRRTGRCQRARLNAAQLHAREAPLSIPRHAREHPLLVNPMASRAPADARARRRGSPGCPTAPAAAATAPPRPAAAPQLPCSSLRTAAPQTPQAAGKGTQSRRTVMACELLEGQDLPCRTWRLKPQRVKRPDCLCRCAGFLL